MRRPRTRKLNPIDCFSCRFSSHKNGNKVTIEVTESEETGQLIVELKDVDGHVRVDLSDGSGPSSLFLIPRIS